MIPPRQWDKPERVETPPVVLVSSRDGAPVPHVAGAERLAAAARAHGWTVRLTYALAAVPDRWFDNGKLAKAAHQLASVAVRLARGAARGWAMWHQIDGAGWRFAGAYIGTDRLGLRGALSIMDRLAVQPT